MNELSYEPYLPFTAAFVVFVPVVTSLTIPGLSASTRTSVEETKPKTSADPTLSVRISRVGSSAVVQPDSSSTSSWKSVSTTTSVD